MKPSSLRAYALASLLLLTPLFLRADDAAKGESKSGVMFSASAYIEHDKYLASDELMGRKPGTPGIELAAKYIAEKFKAAGLEPAGDDGTYFQEFEVNDGRKIEEDKAALEISGIERKFALNKDWTPFPFSKNGEAEGALAFAGYGISAAEFDYDDYKGFDPKDKILLIMRYEPRNSDEKAEFGGKEKSNHSWFATKVKEAADRGAKGLLLVNPASEPEKDELYAFQSWEARTQHDIPMAHITRECANALLKKAGMADLKTLEKQLSTDHAKSQSAVMKGLSAKLVTPISPKKAKTRNVLGMLKGATAPDEVIVVGAHYDHLGFVPRSFGGGDGTPQIHNGADDNASGSSGVIELARAFGAGARPRRSILFMTFSAEEMGLLGSQHFVAHPTIELSRIKAMVNMDMIGRYGQDKFEIYGVDTGEGFDELVSKASADLGMHYKATPRTAGVFGQSDHASFYGKNIPVLFPFTGLHKQYHQPEDDWELIDADGATKVLQLTYTIMHELAQMESGPEFIKPGKKKSDAAKKDDEKSAETASGAAKPESADKKSGEAAKAQAAPRPGPSVRIGIMPGYSEDGKPGLRVDGTIEGQAAEKAGIKEGDRIVRIGKTAVTNIETYMEALGAFKPGDEAEVTISRDGKEQVLKIKLTAGPSRKADDNK